MREAQRLRVARVMFPQRLLVGTPLEFTLRIQIAAVKKKMEQELWKNTVS
jgi:hypothetical protein